MTTARKETGASANQGAGETPPRRPIIEPLFDRQPKYKQLLLFGYFTRYFTTPLIHDCFGSHLPLSTARRYCKTLRDRGYFKTAPKSTTTEAPIHSVTNKAIRYLNQQRPDKQQLVSTRDETISPILLPHEIGLSQLQIDIYASARQHSFVNLAFGDFERRYKHPDLRLMHPSTNGTRYYEPDLGFLPTFKRSGQRHMLRHLLEFDRGTEDPAELLSKMQSLDAWFEHSGREQLVAEYTDRGAGDPKPSYRRLIVTHHAEGRDANDQERLLKILAHLLFLPTETRHNIFLTTQEQITASREDGSLLAKSIWLPLRFTSSWQEDFNGLCQQLENQNSSTHVRNRHLYDFVREHLTLLPLYALFPPVR